MDHASRLSVVAGAELIELIEGVQHYCEIGAQALLTPAWYAGKVRRLARDSTVNTRRN